MKDSAKRILIIDDEPDILEFVGYNLEKEGYIVNKAKSGVEGIKKAKEVLPDLIILDVMMPEMDGIETCYQIKNDPELSHVLITFLTARSEDYSEISGLEAGADDYIAKPIRPRVLTSRVKALLRRGAAAETEPQSDISGFIVDVDRYLIIKDGKEFNLPRKEFKLLKLLLSKPGKVFTREEILSKVWGSEVVIGDRTIDVHIRKLREKFGDSYFATVKGVGYKFAEEA